MEFKSSDSEDSDVDLDLFSDEGPATGFMTPLATEPHGSSTPAWDPLSRTPTRSPRITWELAAATFDPPRPSVSSEPLSPQHILLKEALVGCKIAVKVTGGIYCQQKMDVTISNTNSMLCFRRTKHGMSELIDPSWVEVIVPDPAQSNGLLMVIDGEHCGKHVRRIFHNRDRGVMILAGVHREAGKKDQLTGEELELAPEYVCRVEESPEDKKLNADVMTNLRSEYKKRNRRKNQ